MKINWKDQINKRFNKLIITEVLSYNKYGQRLVRCRCDCGNEVEKLFNAIKVGHVKSCGCLNKNRKRRLVPNEVRFEGQLVLMKVGDREVILDREDYDLVKNHRWCKGAHGYIKTNINGSAVYLHRILVGGDSPQIDHINHNLLDNRRANLRPASHTDNFGNRHKHKHYKGKPTTSIYKGVYLQNNKWHARINYEKRTYKLGKFELELDAAKAYNKMALVLFGEFARINKIKEEI